MKTRKYLLMLFMIITAVACIQPPQQEKEESTTLTSFVGTWTQCKNDNSSSDLQTYVFEENGDLTVTHITFSATGCSDANKHTSEVETYTYSSSGNQLTIVLQTKSLTYHTSAKITDAINNTECNYGDWVLNTTKDIINRTCTYGTDSNGDSNSMPYSFGTTTLTLNDTFVLTKN